MENIIYRGINWCKRIRYRKGYGVHSPYDFFFINFIIYENYPYYAYDSLHHLRRVVEHLPHYREKVDKLIFRIVNFLQPKIAVEVGTESGLTSRYMAEACKGMHLYSLFTHHAVSVQRILNFRSNITYSPFLKLDDLDIVPPTIDLLHIGHTNDYELVFETLYPRLHELSCVILAKPYSTRERLSWWKKIVEDDRTGVTFDLHDLGIIFMDKKRVKEHRIINFL